MNLIHRYDNIYGPVQLELVLASAPATRCFGDAVFGGQECFSTLCHLRECGFSFGKLGFSELLPFHLRF